MEKYCSFFGHSFYQENQADETLIKMYISHSVEVLGINNFLLGGYGDFDKCCA